MRGLPEIGIGPHGWSWLSASCALRRASLSARMWSAAGTKASVQKFAKNNVQNNFQTSRRVTMRSISFAMLFSSLFLLTETATAAEIVVSYTTVEHEVRPRQGIWNVTVQIRLTLRGGNLVGEVVHADNLHGGTRTVSREGTFRESIERGSVTPTKVSWRVGESNTLVRTADAPQHIQTMRVYMTSDMTCRAEVSYRLKPGFKEYKFTSIKLGVPIYESSIYAKNITCRAIP
jgi:hypothetical protein